MTPAHKLIYDFYRKKRGLNTGASQSYKIKDIVAFINEAWFILFENNVQRAEIDIRYEDNIRHLKKTNISIPIQKNTFGVTAIYPEELYKRLNQKAVLVCKGCEGSKLLPITILDSDDIDVAINSPTRKTSFPRERVIAEKTSNGLLIYNDDQDVSIKEVFINYYEKPIGIQAPELVHCNEMVDELGNVIKETINFDANTFISNKVVDVAILLSEVSEGKDVNFQLEFNKINSLEQVA